MERHPRQARLNDEIKGKLDKALKSFGKKFASGVESATKSASAEG